MAREVFNTDDVIDSRDVIERIEELEESVNDGETLTSEERDELEALRRLAQQGEHCGDWEYGEALIRDSYFTDYARELADDIGSLPAEISWPCCHIDWEAAARALKMDYTSLDFGGVTYWVRS